MSADANKMVHRAKRAPRRPLTIPTGSYTFWPVNLALGRSILRYATAQLICKLADTNTYVFFAAPGIPAEFAFEEKNRDAIEASEARVERSAGLVFVGHV